MKLHIFWLILQRRPAVGRRMKTDSMNGYPLFIARRLSLGPGGRKASPAVRVAIAAVALSVALMLASIAIVLGFKKEIEDKVVGFNSHLTVYSYPLSPDDSNIVTLTPTIRNILDTIPYIKDYSLQAVIPGILKTPGDFKGIYFKGIPEGVTREFLASTLEEGEMPDYSRDDSSYKILISAIASRELGLHAGDKVDTYFFSDDIRVRRLEVAGVFNSHFESYDDVLVFGPLSLIQRLAALNDRQGISIVVTVDRPRMAPQYAGQLDLTLRRALAEGLIFKAYHVDNVYNQGAGFFRWLSLLDTNVAVVLILMTFVACITLVSGMLIIILDKKRFIGLMKSLGAPTGKVRQVFMLLAVRIALTGLIIGNAAMLGLLYAQRATHFIPLDPESYYIDFVPVVISWPAVAALNAGVLAVVYLVLILPSRFVSKISPAETMRYE